MRHRPRAGGAARAQLRVHPLRTSLPPRRRRVGRPHRRQRLLERAMGGRPLPRPSRLDGAQALPGDGRAAARGRPQRSGAHRDLYARRQADLARDVRLRFRRRHAVDRRRREACQGHGAGGFIRHALRPHLRVGWRAHAGGRARADAAGEGQRGRGQAPRCRRALLLCPHGPDLRRHGRIPGAAGRHQHRRARSLDRIHRAPSHQAGDVRGPSVWIPERRVPARARPGRHGPAAHRAPAAPRAPARDAHMSVWEIVELARHPQRPYSLDYIRRIAPDFIELHGDRLSADDPALVAGIGTWHGSTTVFLGHQKGRSMKDRVARNWGMMHPEGYRKALRLAHHAAKFGFPIISLIDTPGAYPGAGAEERGIAAAIANAIMEWFRIPVPIVAAVIGEGGSGGALGMGVADRVIMLENSIYSVASPEAAASIVWRDNSRKVEAAEQLQLTSREILAMGVVEEVVPEPRGSASADHDAAARSLDEALYRNLEPLLEQTATQLLQHRYDRFRYIDSLIQAEPHFGPKID